MKAVISIEKKIEKKNNQLLYSKLYIIHIHAKGEYTEYV